MGLSWANLVIGRIGAARQLCSHVGEFRARSECLLCVATAADDSRSAKEQLHLLQVSGPTDGGAAPDLAAAVQFGEIAAARRWSEPTGKLWGTQAWDGLIFLAEGRTREAIEQLRKLPARRVSRGALWYFQQQRLALATALERLGRVDEAIELLLNDTRPKVADSELGWQWPKCRMKLAELYRKAGRADEALKIEDEIRFYLSAADADYPVRVRLGNRQR